MNYFLLWFTKITGLIIEIFYYRKKIYYINKKSQGRRIKGKSIIVSNHASVFDYPLYMYVFFGRTIRPLVAEIMYKRGKLFAWFLKAIGGIYVDRTILEFDFMIKTINIINNGGLALIFPESRLPVETETELLEFKPSFVYIALETSSPIIPIYTNGMYGKKERTKIMIGEKIYLNELYDNNKTEKENITYLTNYVRDYIIFLKTKLHEEEK